MTALFFCRSTSIRIVFLAIAAWVALGWNTVLALPPVAGGQLQEGHPLHLQFGSQQPVPLAMAAGDFDEDGIGDLAIGYAATKGGLIAVLHGNLDAHAPQTQESWLAAGRGQFSDPYLQTSKPISTTTQPGLLIAADVNGDGHLDLVFAAQGDSQLYVMLGDGKGHFLAPAGTAVGGGVTALTSYRPGTPLSGEAIVVGYRSTKGAGLSLLSYGVSGLVQSASYALPGAATAMTVANLDADLTPDIAVVAGGQLLVLPGKGAINGSSSLATLPISNIAAVVAGQFLFDRHAQMQLSVLTTDGDVVTLAHQGFDSRPFTPQEIAQTRQRRKKGQAAAPSLAEQAGNNGDAPWVEINRTAGAAVHATGDRPAIMVRMRASGSGGDDVVVLNSSQQQQTVIRHAAPALATGGSTPPSVASAGVLSATDVVAAVPASVSPDARQGLAMLRTGSVSPDIVLPSAGNTFYVNTIADNTGTNTDPSDGIRCTEGSGEICTLRDAITFANDDASDNIGAGKSDTIMVPSGTYTLTWQAGTTDGNTNALTHLELLGPMTIIGSTTGGGTIINGANNDTILTINPGLFGSFNPSGDSYVFDAALENLTLENGRNTNNITNNGFANYVGGCLNWDAFGAGNLTLINTTLQNCVAFWGPGGGIWAQNSAGGGTGTLIINGSSILNNSTPEVGGGIQTAFPPAAMSISNTTISGNKAQISVNPSDGDADGSGGGIYLEGRQPPPATPRTTLTGVTISSNVAANDNGGGIATFAGILLSNAVISGNSTGGSGGGIWSNAAGDGSSTTITSSDFLGNSATQTGGGIALGIESQVEGNVLQVSLSRIVGNTATVGASGLANGVSGEGAGQATATENWWGCNAGPTTATDECDQAVLYNGGGSLTTAPYARLGFSSDITTIPLGSSANLTVSLNTDSSGNPITGAFPSVAAYPFTFSLTDLSANPALTGGTFSSLGIGTTPFTPSATGSGSVSATFDNQTLSVNFLVQASVIATQSIASATLTVNHAATSFIPVTGSGGVAPLTYTVSPMLPAGLSMNGSTGAIIGTPTVAKATASYTVTVTDSNSASATASFSLTVNGPLTATQAVAATTLTENHAATSFTPVTGSGGISPLVYTVSPTLPTGLSISSSTGAITGTPTATSSATTYTVTVTDANSTTATATFILTVNSAVTATQAVAATALTANHAATPFTPVTGSGGTSPLAYSISPTLPTGLSISSSTGAIAGTPTATSSATTYTVTVTDANSATATATFSLKVNSAVSAAQSVPSTSLTVNHAATAFTPVTGSGGTAPLAYSVSPLLPGGLSISSSTGAISGTPTATSGATTYTVTVTDANSATATATFSLTVNSAVSATQAIASATLTVNHAVTPFTPVTGSGGTSPLAYSVSPILPAGLSISSSTGAISGIPTVTSNAMTYTVTVTDANSATATATFSLTVAGAVTVTQAVPSTALTVNHAAVPFTPVTGSGGTSPLAYSVSPLLPAGLSFSASTGTVAGIPTVTSSATTYTVTVTDANSATATATFSLKVNSAVTANGDTFDGMSQNTAIVPFQMVTGSGGTAPLTYSVSPAVPTGLSFNSSNSTITGIPTVASPSTIYTVTVTDANGATATATSTLAVYAPLTATTAVASMALTANQAAVSFIPVKGGGGRTPYSYSVSPVLPAGLNLSASTGAITGTPTVASVATSYTVTVTDANSSTATATFSLTVNGVVKATQVIASTTLSQGHATTGFTPVTGSGGTSPYSYSVSPALPAGLTLNNSTGAITGTSTGASAATTYTVTVTDANGATASATFSLTVSSSITATQAVPATSLTVNHAAVPFTPVTGSGGTSPLTYSVSPTLPAGLSFSSSTGAIAGIPTTISAATTYTVTVTDANSATATATFSLTINGATTATQVIPSSALTVYQAAVGFAPVAGSGGTSPLSYSVSPALPAGLIFSSSTGAIAGTPTTTSAAATYTVTVTDANSEAATATFALAINKQNSVVSVSANPTSATPAQAVTLSASVAATIAGTPVVPSGSVTFFNNGTQVGTPVSVVSGTATLTVPSLPSGATNTITAIYSGDGTFLGNASANAATVTVAALDFIFTDTGASGYTAAPGAVATYNFALTPLYGSYSGPVSFTVTGLPAGAVASFTPNTVATTASAATAVQLSIQTAPATAHNASHDSLGRGLALALLLLPFAGRRRLRASMKARMLLTVLLMAGITAALTGCGATTGFLLQAPQTYTLTVTATSGSVQHSQTITLNVQ